MNILIFWLVAGVATLCFMISSLSYTQLHTAIPGVFFNDTRIKTEVVVVQEDVVNIPFYVYNSVEFDNLQKACTEFWKLGQHFHNAEYHFARHVSRHPWRVESPEDAVFFIVPVFTNMVARKACGPDGSKLHKAAMEVVRSSPFYKRRNGWDHIVVGNSYIFFNKRYPLFQNFTVGHTGCFPNAPWRCSLPVPYSLNPSAATTSWPLDIALTAQDYVRGKPFNMFFQGKTERNSGYKIRRVAMKNLPGLHGPNVLVSVRDPKMDPMPYPNCTDTFLEGCTGERDVNSFTVRLQRSKFNLHLRGDAFTTSRLYEAIHNGVINIVLADEIWTKGLPSQCQAPWELMTFRASEKDFYVNPREVLEPIVGMKESELELAVQMRLDMIRAHAADVLWEVPYSRVATNLIYNAARKCIPPEWLLEKGIEPSELTCAFDDPSVVTC